MHTQNKCYQVTAAMYIMSQRFTRTFNNALVARIPQVIVHVNNSNRLVLLKDPSDRMWDNVDTAMEQKLSCHVQYESTNLQVNNNESIISNALYYFMCLELNNAYKLQFLL